MYDITFPLSLPDVHGCEPYRRNSSPICPTNRPHKVRPPAPNTQASSF